jgi:hypothetical protein
MRAIIALGGLATLAACTTDGGPSRYATEMERLRATCDQRGGILQPSGANSGEPALDNACIIRGPAGRLAGE